MRGFEIFIILLAAAGSILVVGPRIYMNIQTANDNVEILEKVIKMGFQNTEQRQSILTTYYKTLHYLDGSLLDSLKGPPRIPYETLWAYGQYSHLYKMNILRGFV